MVEHLPVRRTWSCDGCGAPWPCRPAREELLAEYHDATAALAMYMTCAYLECVVDLPDRPAGELYGRFFGWLYFRNPVNRMTEADRRARAADELSALTQEMGFT